MRDWFAGEPNAFRYFINWDLDPKWKWLSGVNPVYKGAKANPHDQDCS